jgi:hypothetical protein
MFRRAQHEVISAESWLRKPPKNLILSLSKDEGGTSYLDNVAINARSSRH